MRETVETMTQQDYDEIDRCSRNLVKNLLQLHSNTDSVEDTHGNCCYDLLWVKKDGRKTAVEIKDRAFKSDKYNDIFCEELKQVCNNRRMGKGEFDNALAVNVFTDNIIALANMNDKDAKHFKCYCNETTLIKGGSRDKILKNCLSLPQRVKIKFNITPNGIVFNNI